MPSLQLGCYGSPTTNTQINEQADTLINPLQSLGRTSAHAFTIFLLLLAPAIGCKSTPANPLIGTWTLTADGTGPQVCAGAQQKVTFTEKSSQTWDNQGRTGGPVMISYVIELPNVYIPGLGGNVTYTVSGDNIIWYSPYGPCTYSKA